MHKVVLALAIAIISTIAPAEFNTANADSTWNHDGDKPYPGGSLYQKAMAQKQTRIAFANINSNRNDHKIDWLLEQSDQNFTLQLARSTNYDDVINLITKHGLSKEKTTIYKSKSPEGPVYTLLYGFYSSKHKAMEVGSSLPKELLGTGVRAIKLDTIQAEIRKNYPPSIKPGNHKNQKKSLPATITKTKKPSKKNTTKPHKKIKSIQPIGNAFRENWILNQKPNHYTIQLTSVSRERLANRYISHHKLSKKVAYFRTLRKKEDWYSILYGSYPTKKAALSARKKIQNDLKIKDAWIRKFADIQNAINKTGSTF